LICRQVWLQCSVFELEEFRIGIHSSISVWFLSLRRHTQSWNFLQFDFWIKYLLCWSLNQKNQIVQFSKKFLPYSSQSILQWRNFNFTLTLILSTSSFALKVCNLNYSLPILLNYQFLHQWSRILEILILNLHTLIWAISSRILYSLKLITDCLALVIFMKWKFNYEKYWDALKFLS